MNYAEQAPPTSDLNDAKEIENTEFDSGQFPGDHSRLPLDTRRVLVRLLAGPSLEARRHSKLWLVLLRDEAIIRNRLSDLFLDLILDRDLQVAFTRQFDTAELDAPILLRRAQLTFIDSVLMLFLRQKLAQADAQEVRPVISASEIEENLTLYERHANTDHAGFTKRVRASIEKIKDYNILHKIRANDERYEISPTLKLLFSAEDIQALTHLYQQMVVNVVDPSGIEAQQIASSEEST
jgi:hypothetical protein